MRGKTPDKNPSGLATKDISISTKFIGCFVKQMLRVSEPEDVFDPLQQLLSPSTVDNQSWYHRRLLRSCKGKPGYLGIEGVLLC